MGSGRRRGQNCRCQCMVVEAAARRRRRKNEKKRKSPVKGLAWLGLPFCCYCGMVVVGIPSPFFFCCAWSSICYC